MEQDDGFFGGLNDSKLLENLKFLRSYCMYSLTILIMYNVVFLIYSYSFNDLIDFIVKNRDDALVVAAPLGILLLLTLTYIVQLVFRIEEQRQSEISSLAEKAKADKKVLSDENLNQILEISTFAWKKANLQWKFRVDLIGLIICGLLFYLTSINEYTLIMSFIIVLSTVFIIQLIINCILYYYYCFIRVMPSIKERLNILLIFFGTIISLIALFK
ncbi:hypothetical protein [Carnobacterium divergens]|uniref:hypothetical protein n=1 Tax=Carnobacterium divergens TaxID=2748 RepID=UPI0028914864|nr:hypothetical protein [Carnobacterium divergens]MDT2011196.1 hypothetical protein [Carnobacterium divergens]